MFKRVGKYFNNAKLEEEGGEHHASENAPFYRVFSATQERVKIKAEALLIKNNMKSSELDKIKADLLK